MAEIGWSLTAAELIFRGYRIVYSFEGAGVTVLRVLHGALDLRRLATREPLSCAEGAKFIGRLDVGSES